MSLYDYVEKAAKDKGYKSMNDFCDKAEISRYIIGRLKWNASIRSDVKAKIAKALKTDVGTVNQMISKTQLDMIKNVVEKPKKASSNDKKGYSKRLRLLNNHQLNLMTMMNRCKQKTL